MEQELWQKVEELFHAALERTPDARQTFLDGNCGVNTDLRRQVELLLAKEAQAGSFLEVPAIEDMPVTLTAAESLLGRQFGDWAIFDPLPGQGNRRGLIEPGTLTRRPLQGSLFAVGGPLPKDLLHGGPAGQELWSVT